ncbi:MAG: GGDEF domain-containing phosphodiesterase, partial [Oscillospiraceae bacterium]
KVLNEQFGRDACNKVLVAIERGIHENLGQHECIGRLFADNFCILMEYKDEESLAKRFDEFYASSARQNEMEGTVWLPLRISFGVYVIGNHPLQIPHMIDRAKLSLRDTSREQRGKLRYAIFDEKERHKLFREKQLEDIMEASLKKREFQVYLQPKYKTQDETVGGAEALVRWLSPTEGMIFPNEFISLFEKNGFIIQIDLFVFEEVCSTIRKWLDAGREPIRISVNCSRVHLRTPGFLNEYKAILARYRIPPRYIEIELTETVVFEDVEQLTNIISEIHRAGFCCSMDDFGSGYSSLNLIQDIPVDVLKLDGIFFRGGERSMVRTEAVIGSIISMSRALSMETVAEGVEDRIHVDMLKRMGCDYIQGYYFAKPMPIADFELLLFGAEAE